ncbi:MAG: acyltransferase, partial [Chitinophagales bacterium]|nr:acyltransferase [Chitinophagales bacterium]
MKRIIENIIRKRNPDFRFDENVSLSLLVSLLMEKGIWMLRGMKVIFYMKKPNRILIGKGVRWFNMRNISFGSWVKLEDYVYLGALGKGKLILGDNVGIGAFSRLIVST